MPKCDGGEGDTDGAGDKGESDGGGGDGDTLAAWLDDPLGHSVYSDTSVDGRSSSFRLREGAVPPTTPGHVLAEPPSGSSASSGHRRSDSGGPSSFRRSASALKSVVTRSLFGWSGPDGA